MNESLTHSKETRKDIMILYDVKLIEHGNINGMVHEIYRRTFKN